MFRFVKVFKPSHNI